MAQADQTVQNATFPTVRADINDNLAALFSDNSGNIAPTVTVAFQDWIDTSGANPLWKKRNAANSAWITLGTIISNTIAFEGTLPSQTSNSGKFLTTDGTTASWETIAAPGRLLRAPRNLTTGTLHTVPADCTSIYVEAVGGGGGGGAATTDDGGGGGGSGGYCAKYFTVVGGTSYAHTIGAGGTGGVGVDGGNGGDTTFTVGATTITAGGGSGGAEADSGTNPRGGLGGSATNGDLNAKGSGGGSGGFTIRSGTGGSSFFGGGGRGVHDGVSNVGERGGGGSGGSNNRDGAAGGSGLIRIWEYS